MKNRERQKRVNKRRGNLKSGPAQLGPGGAEPTPEIADRRSAAAAETGGSGPAGHAAGGATAAAESGGSAGKEAGNAPFCVSQEKFQTAVLQGARNISETPVKPPYKGIEDEFT